MNTCFQVLMRALRDFNLPKIVTDDVPIIMGLIGDLFPSLDVPRKRDMDFEKQIRQATLDQKLQPEDNFILKVMFWEILEEEYVFSFRKVVIIRLQGLRRGIYKSLCQSTLAGRSLSVGLSLNQSTSKASLFLIYFLFDWNETSHVLSTYCECARHFLPSDPCITKVCALKLFVKVVESIISYMKWQSSSWVLCCLESFL